ncbi:MAG TPA: laccase domain-containing protein [Gammaproteobacteria bacterium]|nr:laccase domain-containing protein [Gammaproteobacteria bacterium]
MSHNFKTIYFRPPHALPCSSRGSLPKTSMVGEWCTHSDPARFYSYRRSKDAGRMFNLIWIAD